MAVVDPIGYAILKPWASDTPNVMSFTDIEKSQGIIFKSEIISNQVNGALKDIANGTRWCQYNGGYFQGNTTYDIGNQFAIVAHLKDYDQYVRFNLYVNQQMINEEPFTADIVKTQTPSGYVIYEADSIDDLKSKLKPGYDIDTYIMDYFEAKFKALQEYLEKKVNEAIEKTKDQWINIGNVTGTFNFNLGDAKYEKFNCFIMTVTGQTTFANFVTQGVTDNKSGLIVVQGGGVNIKKFFTSTNVIHTIDTPLSPAPYNTGNGNNFLCFPYYFNPTTNKVYITRV